MVIPFFNRFLHWFAVGVGTTVMSLLILSKGGTIETLGLFTALYSVFVVVFEVPSGILSDLAGQKKIYLLSLGLSIAGYLMLLFSNSLAWLVAGFSLYGISRAFSSGSVEALFINEYIKKKGKAELHRLMSVLSYGETIGLATGALAGGIIPGLWADHFPAQNRFNGNLVVQLSILAILFVFTVLGVVEPSRATQEKRLLPEHLKDSLRIVKKDGDILILIIGTMTWGFCFSAIEVYWQPQVKSILGTDTQTWIFGVINCGYFLASLMGVGVIQILAGTRGPGRKPVFILTRFLAGSCIMLLSFQNTILSFSTVYFLMFMLNGMMSIPEGTLMNALIPDDKRSSVLSLSSLSLQTGGILGSILFSRIVHSLQIPGVWILAGLVFALSSLLFTRLKTGTGKDKENHCQESPSR